MHIARRGQLKPGAVTLDLPSPVMHYGPQFRDNLVHMLYDLKFSFAVMLEDRLHPTGGSVKIRLLLDPDDFTEDTYPTANHFFFFNPFDPHHKLETEDIRIVQEVAGRVYQALPKIIVGPVKGRVIPGTTMINLFYTDELGAVEFINKLEEKLSGISFRFALAVTVDETDDHLLRIMLLRDVHAFKANSDEGAPNFGNDSLYVWNPHGSPLKQSVRHIRTLLNAALDVSRSMPSPTKSLLMTSPPKTTSFAYIVAVGVFGAIGLLVVLFYNWWKKRGEI
eukprot:GHVS01065187.1.p1 GENE.GHVS01065187.1~~GHVS01065187.1.p1  ORF type:complete len:321 (+),score=20.77 GHVS01065187.1:127-963(+)